MSETRYPVACPTCFNEGKVPEAYLGKQIRCKKCGDLFEAKFATPANLNGQTDELDPDVPLDDEVHDLIVAGLDSPERTTRVKHLASGHGSIFHCSMCQSKYEAGAEMVGKAIRCPVCSEWGQVSTITDRLGPSRVLSRKEKLASAETGSSSAMSFAYSYYSSPGILALAFALVALVCYVLALAIAMFGPGNRDTVFLLFMCSAAASVIISSLYLAKALRLRSRLTWATICAFVGLVVVSIPVGSGTNWFTALFAYAISTGFIGYSLIAVAPILVIYSLAETAFASLQLGVFTQSVRLWRFVQAFGFFMSLVAIFLPWWSVEFRSETFELQEGLRFDSKRREVVLVPEGLHRRTDKTYIAVRGFNLIAGQVSIVLSLAGIIAALLLLLANLGPERGRDLSICLIALSLLSFAVVAMAMTEVPGAVVEGQGPSYGWFIAFMSASIAVAGTLKHYRLIRKSPLP